MSDDPAEIRERLKALIQETGLSYQAFSQPLGFAASTIKSWLNGTREFKPRHIALISAVYSVSIRWLTAGEPPKFVGTGVSKANQSAEDRIALYRQIAEERLERIRLLERLVQELESHRQ